MDLIKKRNTAILSLFAIMIIGVKAQQLLPSLVFTSDTYAAYISSNTAIGDRVQQIIAISHPYVPTITYSLEENDYVKINSTTGDIHIKALVTASTGALTFSVTAASGEISASSTLRIMYMSGNPQCVCFQSTDTLSLAVPEEARLPYGILYMNPQCGAAGYTITGSSMLMLDDGHDKHLVINSSSTAVSDKATVQCRTDKLTVNIVRYATPSIIMVGNKRSYFLQYNQSVDPNQMNSLKGKTYRLVFTSETSDLDRWAIIKTNDPTNQLIIGPLTPMPGPPRMSIYSIEVSWSKQLKIKKSADIDITVVDKNLVEKALFGTNVTWRFNLTYNDVDELDTLELNQSYRLTVNKTTPSAYQLLRIEHNLGSSLTFELHLMPRIIACSDAFNITSKQGIFYVSSSEALKRCAAKFQMFNLRVSQNGRSREAKVIITLSGDTDSEVNSTDLISCSSFSDKESCESSAGVGTYQCLWQVFVKGDPNVYNYSSCIPTPSCGDSECNELESLYPELCPQDCHKKWLGENRMECGENVPGICRGFGICYCYSAVQHCQCLLEEHLNSAEEDYEDFNLLTNLTQRDGVYGGFDDAVCDLNCIVIVSVFSSVIIIGLVVISLWCHHRYTRKIRKGTGINAWRVAGNNLHLTLTPCPDYGESTPSTIISTMSDWSEHHPYNNIGNMELYDERWELPRYNLVLEGYIGEGEFGRVMKAKYRNDIHSDWSTVAVKMLKDGASRSEFCDLLSEYNLLKEVDHPNIIKLIGAATLNGPFHLVVEYCELGSLKSHLRKIRSSEPIYMNGCTQYYTEHATELLGYAWQISKGMQYLSEIKLVHRDLATRNILISDDNIIKISDFGMTKDIYEEDAYKKKGQGRIPVKWMAPESLYHQVYTSKSDVWSFGIVLWEMATLGATPYPGIPPERMYQLLQDGYRMDRPETCSASLYSLMRHCWEYDPPTRPTFKDIKERLEAMVEDKAEYLDLSVAHAHRLCSSEFPSTSGSEEDNSEAHLTVALLPNSDMKCTDNYLISSNDRQTASKHRYTVLEFEEE